MLLYVEQPFPMNWRNIPLTSTAYRHANRFIRRKCPRLEMGCPRQRTGWSGVASRLASPDRGLAQCLLGQGTAGSGKISPIRCWPKFRTSSCRSVGTIMEETNAMQFTQMPVDQKQPCIPGSISGREAALNSPPWKGLAWVIVWRISNDNSRNPHWIFGHEGT